jgi:hypothetical protein
VYMYNEMCTYMYSIIYSFNEGTGVQNPHHLVITTYRIFSNRGPGFYFLPDSRDPASKRDRRLNGTGVYLCSPVLAPGRMSARSAAQALFSEFLTLL